VPLFQALELSPDAVFVTDRHNRIVFWNDAARFLLGFTEDEALGADCDALLGGCDSFGNRYCSDDCPVMRMANRGETVRNFSLTLRSKEQSMLTTSMAVLQLRAGAADDYYLAHIIHTAAPPEPHAPSPSELAPPRPRLVAARESTDVRARKLTSREVEVLAMLAAGRSTPEIAERLHISQLTARSHIQNILEKLEVHSKAEAVAFAFQKNLI
jgi:DNA-binding CsgD family transcriptional regulator